MSVRVLAAIVIAAGVVAAACGGSSKATPTATPRPSQTSTPVSSSTAGPATEVFVPFTPVEEVLTPPPDVDTSGWLTYRDAANGFELKYPPGGEVKMSVQPPTIGVGGMGSEIDLPVVPGTTLENKYLFVTVVDMTTTTCLPHVFTDIPKPEETPVANVLRSSNAEFWREREPAGYMHQWADTEVYMTSRGGTCVTVNGVLAGHSSTTRTSLPPPDVKGEARVFDAMVSTFRWVS